MYRVQSCTPYTVKTYVLGSGTSTRRQGLLSSSRLHSRPRLFPQTRTVPSDPKNCALLSGALATTATIPISLNRLKFRSGLRCHLSPSLLLLPPTTLRFLVTMSSAMRLGSSALRTSLKAPAFRSTSFTAARCYSAKTQVCSMLPLAFQIDSPVCRSALA